MSNVKKSIWMIPSGLKTEPAILIVPRPSFPSSVFRLAIASPGTLSRTHHRGPSWNGDPTDGGKLPDSGACCIDAVLRLSFSLIKQFYWIFEIFPGFLKKPDNSCKKSSLLYSGLRSSSVPFWFTGVIGSAVSASCVQGRWPLSTVLFRDSRTVTVQLNHPPPICVNKSILTEQDEVFFAFAGLVLRVTFQLNLYSKYILVLYILRTGEF